MYIGHGRLCVCLSLSAFPHYCTDPDVSWGNALLGGFLQSVHGLHCCDSIAPNAKCQRVLVLAMRGLEIAVLSVIWNGCAFST